MTEEIIGQKLSDQIKILDEKLSTRFIALDPKGYFIIKVICATNEILVEHYTNNINEKGIAINPDTGKPLECNGSVKRTPIHLFTGKSAKEVGIKLTESSIEELISSPDHALYIGRELQKAEECLKNGTEYIQD
tara:strand:- start:327 stop:728 length:402 start_codon:yes stop_codon:yes gene_type:complete